MTNNASDTLSIHDLSNPREPVETTAVKRKGDGHPYQLAFSSNGEWLYIVKHRKTPIGPGDVLDLLKVMPDGTGQEFGWSPVTLPEKHDLLARPQGGLFTEPATPCTASPTPPASCA